MHLSVCVLASEMHTFSSSINNLHYRGYHSIIWPQKPALRSGEQRGWDSRFDFRTRAYLTLIKPLKTFQFLKIPVILKAPEAENPVQKYLPSSFRFVADTVTHMCSLLLFFFHSGVWCWKWVVRPQHMLWFNYTVVLKGLWSPDSGVTSWGWSFPLLLLVLFLLFLHLVWFIFYTPKFSRSMLSKLIRFLFDLVFVYLR